MFLKLLRYVFFLLLAMGVASQPTRDAARSELVNTTLPFGTMYTSRSGAVIHATFDNGPINIMNWDMIRDLATFVDSISNDTSVKVVIFDSANPEFFIAQLSLLSQEGAPEPTVQTKTFIETAFNISTLPIVFIAEIAGRARGAGNELILQCDLRYAAKGRALLGNFETALGLIPGAGGIQYLVNLVGRGKAMEYVLSGRDVDAETAADIGWINSAHEPADLPLVVQNMADRLALFPREGLAAAKQRINANMPTHQSIMDDYYAWIALVPDTDAKALVAKEQVLSKNESYGVYQLYEGEEVLNLYN